MVDQSEATMGPSQGDAPAPAAPAANQPTAPAQPPAGNDWMKSAQGVDTQSADLSGQKVPQQPVQTVPVPITPLKRPGLLGVLDSVADALAGKTRPELGVDPDGNKYIKQHTLSRGEQWMKIAGEGIAGAAAGLAAGRGRGNIGKAAFAGVQEGEHLQDRQNQDEQQMQGEVDKDQLAKANNQMLQMKIAEHNWTMAQNQTKATEDQIKFNDTQIDRLTSQGGKILGTAAHPGDIAEIMKVQPDVMEQLVRKGTVQIRSHIGEDGKVNGITAILMPQDWGKTMLPGGATGHYFDPIKGQVQEFKYSDPVSQGEVAANDAAAVSQQNDFLLKKADIANKNQATDTSKSTEDKNKAQTKVYPSEISKNNAEAAKARADAGAAGPNLAGLNIDQQIATFPPATQTAVKGLLTYQTDPATFPQRKMAKSGQMDRETAVGLAQQMDPSYDEKQYGARHKLLIEFTSGHAAQNIRSLNTAIQHLDEMEKSGTALGNTNFQGVNAAKNVIGPWFGTTAPGKFDKDVNAVADEMSTLFKGTAGTDEQVKGWKATMSKAQTPGQIKTGIDEALSLMDGRYNALDHQYTTGMGRARDFKMLSPNSEQILNRLGAKEFAQKDAVATPPSSQGAQEKIQAGEPTAKFPDGTTRVVRNGQWVPAQP